MTVTLTDEQLRKIAKLAAYEIATNADKASEILHGPRFMFQEFVDATAKTILSEMQTELRRTYAGIELGV